MPIVNHLPHSNRSIVRSIIVHDVVTHLGYDRLIFDQRSEPSRPFRFQRCRVCDDDGLPHHHRRSMTQGPIFFHERSKRATTTVGCATSGSRAVVFVTSLTIVIDDDALRIIID